MKIWENLFKKKEPSPVRSTDEKREEILKFLFSKYKNAYDTNQIWIGESRIIRSLHKIGIEDRETTSGLVYLGDSGWIEKKTEIYNRGELEVTEKVNRYRISVKGINYYEGSSKQIY
jgi:hypothetical protein